MISNLFKFILGFLLAMAILVGGGVATALYFMNRSAIVPPKPIYANDNPQVKAQAPKTPAPNSSATLEPVATPSASPTPTPTATEKSQTDETNKPLPPGAFPARVTWPQGLSLRTEPKAESERAGGAGFNQKVIVLEESDDKVWKKIRIEDSNQEGWVKAGNLQQIDANEANQDNKQTDETDQTR
jgi:Bacterial SH3 domain